MMTDMIEPKLQWADLDDRAKALVGLYDDVLELDQEINFRE